MTLRVPQARDGSFSTDPFKRFQRSEQALVLTLMERVVNGVSTRNVTHITEQLRGASFSKTTVSALCVSRVPCGKGRHVHLLRNVMGYVSHRDKAEIASAATNVLRATHLTEARTRLAAMALHYPRAVKAIGSLEAGLDHALAVLALPRSIGYGSCRSV